MNTTQSEGTEGVAEKKKDLLTQVVKGETKNIISLKIFSVSRMI